jgi:hypothetical protein
MAQPGSKAEIPITFPRKGAIGADEDLEVNEGHIRFYEGLSFSGKGIGKIFFEKNGSIINTQLNTK